MSFHRGRCDTTVGGLKHFYADPKLSISGCSNHAASIEQHRTQCYTHHDKKGQHNARRLLHCCISGADGAKERNLLQGLIRLSQEKTSATRHIVRNDVFGPGDRQRPGRDSLILMRYSATHSMSPRTRIRSVEGRREGLTYLRAIFLGVTRRKMGK